MWCVTLSLMLAGKSWMLIAIRLRHGCTQQQREIHHVGTSSSCAACQQPGLGSGIPSHQMFCVPPPPLPLPSPCHVQGHFPLTGQVVHNRAMGHYCIHVRTRWLPRCCAWFQGQSAFGATECHGPQLIWYIILMMICVYLLLLCIRS